MTTYHDDVWVSIIPYYWLIDSSPHCLTGVPSLLYYFIMQILDRFLLVFIHVLIIGLATGTLEQNHNVQVSINHKLYQVGTVVDITCHHFSYDQLEKLDFLTGPFLKVLLYPSNQLLLTNYFALQVDKDTALDHAKSILYPGDFFPLKGTELDIPRSIQNEIFELLKLESIQVILEKDDNYKRLKSDFLATIKKPNILSILWDLVVKESKNQVLECLDKAKKLKNISKKLKDRKIGTYNELYQAIYDRLEEERDYTMCLERHSFFLAEERLSIILDDSYMESRLKMMIVDTIDKQVPVPYRYFLQSYYGYHLAEFLLSDSCNILLSNDLKTWPSFLDSYIVQLMKEKGASLEFLLKDSFGIKVKNFTYEGNFDTWGKVAQKYFELARQRFQGYMSIKTYQQLVEVGSIPKHVKLDQKLVETICIIIDFIPPVELLCTPLEEGTNLLVGVRKAMANSIERYSGLNPLLEAIFSNLEIYGYSFLKELSKNNKTLDNLTAMDQFLDRLASKNELEILLKTLPSHKNTDDSHPINQDR